MPREKSAGAIIFREEEGKRYYLLLQYKSGHWEFVKGHLEEGENELDTLKRETLEETGIRDIETIDGFKEIIKYFFRQYNVKVSAEDLKKGKTPWVFKLVVFYLAKTKTKEVTISQEHEGFIWLPYEEALKKLTFKNAKEILKKANDFIEEKNIQRKSS